MFFEYGEEQIRYLSQRDGKLGEFITKRGFVERKVFGDFFEGLCYSIVNQQLSMKACDTLWGKIAAEFGEISPEKMRCAERLKRCGLSQSKAECIERCAELFISGELSENRARVLSDKELIEELTRIKGIGEWTAEMTAIFCLSRQDILSLSDFGIRKGLSLLHGVDVKDKRGMERFKELYSPYGTVASIYLWEIAGGGIG
ncbi:MAG: DNA-3-methyladenine glycosylase 2 family protein [Oscillospiraceae bacterium]|nr:DNA-3-methyladenine glycosylase 2 family protein [Oscillospiraceae bacterium]